MILQEVFQSFDKYYMPLVEIKDFSTLTDNKSLFDQPVKKTKQKVHENSLKCQEIMIIQQELY